MSNLNVMIFNNCLTCGSNFLPNKWHPQQKYCSQKCNSKARNAKNVIKQRQFSLNWSRRNRKRQKATTKAWRERNKEHERLNRIAYRKDNPLVAQAQSIASKIPMQANCEKCGVTQNLERHHPDYNFPKAIVTLCRNCHAEEHRKIRWQ